MEIRIQDVSQDESLVPGGIGLRVCAAAEELEQLQREAIRALEIERSLPAEARTRMANASDEAYTADFVLSRLTNDALEARGIIPLVPPQAKLEPLYEDGSLVCDVYVHPRPALRLSSMDPADFKVKRIPKPGFSDKDGAGDEGGIEYVDDDTALRRALVSRLVGELPESAMRALGDAYQRSFERDLAARNIDVEMYKQARGLDDEKFAIMMTRQALSDAHWDLALDAAFDGAGLSVTDDDLSVAFDIAHPGCAEQLVELHELRNDLWKNIQKIRRGKALAWLRSHMR